MATEDWFALVAVLVCLLLSFFFAGSETALIASSRAHMRRLEKHGNHEAGLVNQLMAMRERLIGALLLGNNAVNIAASSLATSVLLVWFGDVGVIYATVLMTIEGLVRAILRLFGIRVGENMPILSAHEELRGAVDLLHHEDRVEKSDRDMFGGVLDLRELTVSDVMLHRTKITTLDAEAPPENIGGAVLAAPVPLLLRRGTPENIIGILHSKDL